MSETRDFRGVVCPIITPFDEMGQIDEDSLGNLLEHIINGGVQGVMVAGTTGEGMLLSGPERKHLTELVIKSIAGRVKVIVHVGCMDTRTTVELGDHAATQGADAIAAIVPYFFTYDDESIYTHFKTLGDALPEMPLFPYVFPANAKNDIQPDLFKRLVADIPSIAGIKSSNPDLFRLRDYISAGRGTLSIFCGVDGLMLPALVEGACGQVSGNANVFPTVFCGLYEKFSQGNIAAARLQQERIDHIRRILGDGLHPPYFKTVLMRNNVIHNNTVRRPMRDLNQTEVEQLVEHLTTLASIGQPQTELNRKSSHDDDNCAIDVRISRQSPGY
jgi:dihydrodipicolinate synthase/N-acetylneuraminate lyase